MNVLEKAEKSLDYLKSNEGSSKVHEIQAAAGTLGRCLGALGSRPNCAGHYVNLLHSAIPTLLTLASNNSAEVRLLGDEALNRAVAGGFATHSYKTNIILQNQIDTTKNARWIRAVLSRICLGDCWLRPGVGKIRSQAQTLFPKLSQIVRQTSEVHLIVEALENNLPRILKALAEYTTDEEISELSKALLSHVESSEPAIRRGIANCVAHLCSHREPLLPNILERVFEKLWPSATEETVVLGWFCVIKAVFQLNDISKFIESDVFSVQDFLELYQLCVHYAERGAGHNVHNTVLECLCALLARAEGGCRRALERAPGPEDPAEPRPRRSTSHSSAVSSRTVARAPAAREPPESREPELVFRGALQLGSLLDLATPSISVENLAIQTPESPGSECSPPVDLEQLGRAVGERLRECEEDADDDLVTGEAFKVNIGSAADADARLKYCARMLAAKFLLSGGKGGLVPDRSVRVSVKASALACLAAVLRLCPQAATLYLDKDADIKLQNCSGTSEGTDTNQDNINEFILERNVCYQDSITESLSQELLNRSVDSQVQVSKKDSKSLEKSTDSELKSLKDVPSNILDSKAFAKDLVASGLSADSTNPNMTNSNFTLNSNMTVSNDRMSTEYPMSSSGDILSSSIDLDMKFDHFGESTTNLEVLVEKKEIKVEKEVFKEPDLEEEAEFEFQHMSDVFRLLEGHGDPQVRGLVRVCVGNYLGAALDAAHGDYHRWRPYLALPQDVGEDIAAEKLMDIVLKGLSDEVHSAVNHSLSALGRLAPALCRSVHWALLGRALGALAEVQHNPYWLCRVNLAKLYEQLPYQKIFILFPDYKSRSKLIMESLFHLLRDQDQKVRTAAAQAIASIVPTIYPPPRSTPLTMMAELCREHSRLFSFEDGRSALEPVREMFFYHDLPPQLRAGERLRRGDNLAAVLGDLCERLMASNCKNYSLGLLAALQAVCRRWPPWRHAAAYSSLGLLGYCLEQLECCGGGVAARTMLLDVARLVYPVEMHDVLRLQPVNRDMFERASPRPGGGRLAALAGRLLQATLKTLNVLAHLLEEVSPSVHLSRGVIALPGSPVRKKPQDQTARKGSVGSEAAAEKGPARARAPAPATSLRASFAGHFCSEPLYMKLYDGLRAAHSNHKINLDPKGSMFYEFLSTTLNSLAIQLELATEKEFGPITEEVLYYLRVVLPLSPELAVQCVTQLLKCLFGTNMVNQYADFMSIADEDVPEARASFFRDVLLVNSLKMAEDEDEDASDGQRSADDCDPQVLADRHLLVMMENFSKNRTDRKWSTNKNELEQYIRLFEPVVIQALKSYTMQHDIPKQSGVLRLLCQLLALRLNYCMLDSDQVFIGYLMRQLELVEQHEVPNCCELVNSILLFLVQLSSSKHHTKQIIEIPKLIQLCDGLMAAGAQDECVAGLQPVAVRVFSSMGGASVLGRAAQQEAQATREVLFYMLQKTMHQPRVLELVSSVLALSREQPESYYRWSELAADTLLNLLSERSLECDCRAAVAALERLLRTLHRDVLLEQARVEVLLKILFKAPPAQGSTSRKLKLRYLIIVMVLLRKVLVLIPESEILLSINYLKSTCIAPQSIFFNVKQNIDPLNVQNVNENCANLSPDVILVRFLFKTVTYAVFEMDEFQANVDVIDEGDKDQDCLLYSVCVNIIVQVKHMLHLTNGCLFPLTAKMAQTILHNEQSGLNTGLYSPEENIPLDRLNLICLRAAHRLPLLTAHWSHLLIRLNLLSHKYWQKLVGFVRGLPLHAAGDCALLRADLLQTACALAYCEYFVDNGLSEAVHLTWLLVNRIHVLISQLGEEEGVVLRLLERVQCAAGAAALLLQAVAARCQASLQGPFALNTCRLLAGCPASQSGALVFLVCRVIGKLEPAVAVRFAKLAIERCQALKNMPPEHITSQLSKEDVQVALELLQRDKVHIRYSRLVVELNALASAVFDLSPLDVAHERAVRARAVLTTAVDGGWLLNQAKSRCCQRECISKVSNQDDLAHLLANLSLEDLTAVMTCPDFDRKILKSCFKVACDSFIRDFFNVTSAIELKEAEITAERERKEMARLKEEMSSSIDSNKLNVVNSLHVFKKSDNKESKSQFFIPMSDSAVKEQFGNLKISEEESEIIVPDLPKMYQVGLKVLDKSLTDILRLFPKQSRPLSQSENFNLNIEQTIDRYTRRCHQVFQDKLFYQEFVTIQAILKGFLHSLDRILSVIDEADCDLLEKCIDNIIPDTLARNLAVFSVVSLQYMSFLIKNKKIVQTPVHADVSFRVPVASTDNVSVDHVLVTTIKNVAQTLTCKEIWSELNLESNLNRTQSAISCLYAIVKYLVKDKKPLTLKSHMNYKDEGPKPDIIITGNKLLTLIDYWQDNFYVKHGRSVLGERYRRPLESLLVSLSRIEVVSNIALIPPIAWSYVDVKVSKDLLEKIDLPLQALLDMDVLEAFLFRVNLIGWSSKKQFEEIWMGLLGALQGNGAHWAVTGITQLLLSTAPTVRGRGMLHVPRGYVPLTEGMARLKQILVGTPALGLFEDVNLERVSLARDGAGGFQYGQFSTEYLKYASDLSEQASFRVRREVRRGRRSADVDVNSCLQILLDVTGDLLQPQAPTGAAARVALVRCVSGASGVFRRGAHWARAAGALALSAPSPALALAPASASPSASALQALATCLPVVAGPQQELATVHEKLLKSLASSFPPLRQAALRGWLLQLSPQASPSPHEPLTLLRDATVRALAHPDRLSLYEQSVHWAVLFRLVERGRPELMAVAVDFLLARPRHYCADLIVKGITSALRQPVLPKELRNSAVERLLAEPRGCAERHAVQLLLVHLFSADSKLISPAQQADACSMDPDVLVSAMERVSQLYAALRGCRTQGGRRAVAAGLRTALRDTLPPAAALSRVVLEFLGSCRPGGPEGREAPAGRGAVEACVLNAEIVFEVFETAVAQQQLAVLSGWTFEALRHLLAGKVPPALLPACLLVLLVAASANPHVRRTHPLARRVLREALLAGPARCGRGGPCGDVLGAEGGLSFWDRRLLCAAAVHSGFSGAQLARLRELCEGNDSLKDVLACLDAMRELERKNDRFE